MELHALCDAQGEKIRQMKEAIKADPNAFTKDDLNKEVGEPNLGVGAPRWHRSDDHPPSTLKNLYT